MRTGRLVFGILLALVALFTGGCGLIFFVSGLQEELHGDDTYGLMLISLIGIVPGIAAGIGAFLLIGSARRPGPPETRRAPDPGTGRPPEE